MTTDILKSDPPEIKWGVVIAVLLEISILLTFIHQRSICGFMLCMGYIWFSANLVRINPQKVIPILWLGSSFAIVV